MPATFISDDETDEPNNPPAEGPITMTPSDAPADKPPRSESEGVTNDFTVNPTVIPSDDQDEPLLKSDQAALMRLHEQLGHCSFLQLKQMAEQGIIPRKLAKVPPPKCPSCLYGKAHRKPWRTHKIDPKIKPTTVLGAVVSIDQLESPVPGFVPIAKGQPTVRRYRGASVFVDHVSDFMYVHMHQHLTTDETIDAKHAFERLAEQHGVRILHYHCDNGRFADKAFVDDVHAAHQTITFCSVGAHHQNGIAEWRIRDITKNLLPPCSTSVAQDHSCLPMAPSNQARRQCAQFTSTTGKYRIAVVEVRWDICPAQLEALSSIWVPFLRPPGTIANENPISEVGRTLQNWHFLMSFATSCVLRPTHPFNSNRACQPTIPLRL